MTGLTDHERYTLEVVERLGASISLVSVCLIFTAYGLFKRVRTVPNTFIFFASIANVGASIACVIGYAGIAAGFDSHLCQAQAFLLEMFMQSDPWWSFAMAVNVLMVFFYSYPPNNFFKHLWIYCLVCFGIPAIPAFVCLLYAPNGKRIYGNATLWCWIDDAYNELRLITYYGPIWLCILLSAVIYGAVGYHVFHQRNQLRNLTLSNQANDHPSDDPSAAEKGQHSYATVTTEVQVTAESSASPTPPSTPSGSIAPVLQRPLPTAAHGPWDSPDSGGNPVTPTSGCHHNKQFTTTSTVSSAPRPQESDGEGLFTRLAQSWGRFRTRLANLDPIKLAYLRTSFIFAISILVTWTPSSINRVYSFKYPSRVNYPLNLAGAVVLPLQGLWNAIIFAATSWRILKEEFADRRWCRSWPGLVRLGSAQSWRRRLSDDPDHFAAGRSKQPVTPGGWRTSGHDSVPEIRELPTIPRVSNMRVIKGGSL